MSLLLYAIEKYSSAIRILATNPHDVRSRLRSASFDILSIGPDMVPDDEGVRDDIHWLYHQMTRLEPKYDGHDRVSATLSRIRKLTAARIAERVVIVHAKLESIYRAHHDCLTCPLDK